MEQLYISNALLNEMLEEYCKKTYDALGVTLNYFPSDLDSEDITCFATFTGGGNTIISSSEMKAIAQEKLNANGINVDGIRFGLDSQNKYILFLENPSRKTVTPKGK